MSEMYTERLLDHYRNPRNKGCLEASGPSDSAGEIRTAEEYNPLCGDRVTIQVLIAEGHAVEARFEGRGCALCLGAASILTETVKGQSLDDLAELDQDRFLAELQSPIRPARLKCALLPWMALRHALFGEVEWPQD